MMRAYALHVGVTEGPGTIADVAAARRGRAYRGGGNRRRRRDQRRPLCRLHRAGRLAARHAGRSVRGAGATSLLADRVLFAERAAERRAALARPGRRPPRRLAVGIGGTAIHVARPRLCVGRATAIPKRRACCSRPLRLRFPKRRWRCGRAGAPIRGCATASRSAMRRWRSSRSNGPTSISPTA